MLPAHMNTRNIMDPFTLIAGATAIYNSIKSSVDAGKDVMETAEKVGNLFSKVAQIRYNCVNAAQKENVPISGGI